MPTPCHAGWPAVTVAASAVARHEQGRFAAAVAHQQQPGMLPCAEGLQHRRPHAGTGDGQLAQAQLTVHPVGGANHEGARASPAGPMDLVMKSNVYAVGMASRA